MLKWIPTLVALVALPGCTCGHTDVREDAGSAPRASARDAGVEAPVDVDAGLDSGVASAPTEDEVLRREIAALDSLLAGRLPARVDPQSLFEIDLLDESARAARLLELHRAIAASDPRAAADTRPAGVADAGGTDAGGSDVGGPDAGASQVADAAPQASLRDRAAALARDALARAGVDAGSLGGDAGRAADSGSPDDAGPRRDAGSGGDAGRVQEDPLAALRLERARLRLAFLRLPAAERDAVNEALRRRRRMAAEEEASRVDAERATADAERANVARREALDRAAATVSAISRDLLAESARLEDARGELARWETRLAHERRAVVRRDAETLELAHDLERRIAAGDLEPSEASRRYDALVEQLEQTQSLLARSVGVLGGDSTAPAFEPQLDPSAPLYRNRPERQDLLEALAVFEGDRTRAISAERALHWDRAERLAWNLRRLDRLRIALFPHMTRARRETLQGLGADGFAQAARELGQTRLLARFWLRREWHELPTAPARVALLLTRASSRKELLAALALFVALVMSWRRRDEITHWLRAQVHERTGPRRWVEAVRPFWAVIGALIVPLVSLLGLHLLFGLLSHLTDSLVLTATKAVVLGFAWCFVAITAIARLFTSRLRYAATRAATARRVLSSLRLVLGFGLTVWLMLRLSEELVGHGYLYTLVVDVAWLGFLPLSAYLIHHWSDDVTTAHTRRYPNGFCARQLAHADTRWRRYALVVPAAAQVAVLGATTALSDLALRFEQARRAVTFLVRRRFERQSEEASGADVSALPEELSDAFESPVCPPELLIDHYPELDRVVRALDQWQVGGPGFSTALVGERGSGKTTWLRALARTTSLEAPIIEVPHGLTEPADVVRWVADVLELGGAETVDELAQRVESSGRRRVLLLDHCQNLVVRAIGGTAALGTLVELAARTSASVFWVCSFSRYTWLYLEHARQAQNLFRDHVDLGPWPEDKIAALIHRRMEALGVEASFADLVVDRLRGSALEDAVLRTEGEYLRLLWDYAKGSPGVALHFWLRSLVPAGEGLRVRLFSAPRPEALEELHEQSRFLLAAVVLHENLADHEAAATMNLAHAESAALFAFLEQRGFVEQDEQSRWRVTLSWYREIIRYLRRKRLLFD